MSVAKLDTMAAAGELHALNVFKCAEGFQASLRSAATGGYRVRRAATPLEAIALVLDMDFVDDADVKAGTAAGIFD